MNIGLYTNNFLPNAGGAFTLLESIINDIISSDSKHQFTIFFNDALSPERYNKNNINYVNCYIKKHSMFYSFLRKIRKLLGFNIYNKTEKQILNKEKIDFLWILGPFYVFTDIPYVFTIWDLGPRMLPCFPELNGHEFNTREEIYSAMLPKATYVVTGNQIGKEEILSNYSINPEKIIIIPFPIPSFYTSTKNQNILPSFDINFPFIFYPAQFWAHKNHFTLIKAIYWLKKNKNITINCYFSGHDYGNLKFIKKIINKFELNNQIFILGFIKKEDLIYLYKNALAMVYLSLLGPNNLPLLEAASLGCPLIYSNIPGHLEQMDNIALSVNALNHVEVGEAIFKIYSDSDFRKNLIMQEKDFCQKHESFSYFKHMQTVIDNFSKYYNLYNY